MAEQKNNKEANENFYALIKELISSNSKLFERLSAIEAKLQEIEEVLAPRRHVHFRDM